MPPLSNNCLNITFPEWAQEMLNPYRFKIIYGGRGSGKSYTVADFLIYKSLQQKGTILCGREFQNSIKNSVHAVLKERIEYWQLTDKFTILRDQIICKNTKTNFIFIGLSRNVGSLKSIQNIIYCWIEEGAYMTKESWVALVPTVRAKNSEIIVTFNPLNKNDIIYKEFVLNAPPDNALVTKISFRDNPFFADPLLSDRVNDLKTKDTCEYMHKWEGECLEHSHAQIFKDKWQVIAKEDFIEPEDIYPYYGLDFGFSQDPTAGIRCFVNDNDNKLYITHEAVKIGLEIDHTLTFLEEHLPDVMNYTIYADNARPESISFLKRQGLSIKAVEKGKGSVEDGLEYIKSFDGVVIHERCVETINEFTLYSYKVDERSGDITNKIVDKQNHLVDALRYALERSMKKGKSPTLKQLDTFDNSMTEYYEEKKYKSLFGY
jgi:phage terminase large subunit